MKGGDVIISSRYGSEWLQRDTPNVIPSSLHDSGCNNDAANESRGVADIRSLLMASGEQFASRPALSLGMRIYTYAELCQTANRWASFLKEIHGGTPRRVGILAFQSMTSYLGVMACLYAGSAFVPLNPRFPVERTRVMCEQADLDALLVDEQSLSHLAELLPRLMRVPTIILPETDTKVSINSPDGCRIFTQRDLSDHQNIVSSPVMLGHDTAYLLFTSGSTGTPKGVPITYANLRACLDFASNRYRLTPNDRLTQTFDQTFDLSIFDLLMAWTSGACVYPIPPVELFSPINFVNRHQITLWFSVPSVASRLLKRGALRSGCMPSLRWSLFCGEGLPRVTAEAWQSAAPQSQLDNLYGPTELTIACSAYRWKPESSPADCTNGLVPIGEMFSGLSFVIVNNQCAEVEPGEVGELCVTGAQMFSGYWRAPERSMDCFLHQEVSGRGAAKYYRTGDLVSKLGTNLVYRGRKDRQIKISGYRIELGEVEAALRRAGCVEAAVLAFPVENPEFMVAFVSGNDDTDALFESLRENLPPYVLPKSIVQLKHLPLNSNMKVDHGALRNMFLNVINRFGGITLKPEGSKGDTPPLA
jgi:amino acid adenylation domain-containing protein